MKEKFEKIGIVFAMEGEAIATIAHYNLKKIKTKAGIEIYANQAENIFISLNGKCPTFGVDNVGTQAAVLNAFLLCQEVNPDIIINAGTAGGFKRAGGNIGDVYLGHDRVGFHDRRIPMPGYYEYGMGNYKLLNTDIIANELGLKVGIISTGNSLDITEKDLEIMSNNNAVLKEMEAASIAWVCELLNKPFIPIKSVTDLVDNEINTAVEFQDNFQLATKNLNFRLIELIDYLQFRIVELIN